ncbi:MAG: DUF411 domain-containing protein [Geminicoccaceae bacterium]
MTRLARRTLVAAGAIALAGPGLAARQLMEVWKNRGCTCCTAWAESFRAAGFLVTMHELDDLTAARAAAGVPSDLAGCHTARIAGYTVEGHVPLEDVERLLATRPPLLGLAVPGMPMGSPGMEMPGMAGEAFQVIGFASNGKRHVFRDIPAG